MRKVFFLLVASLLVNSFLVSDVMNEDRPIRGKWDFKKKEIFRLSEAGSELFANIGQMVSDETETLYVMDRKRVKIHIFNKDGEFLSSFGQKGEGPGEIKSPPGMAIKADNLVVFDAGKVHYFTKKGEYQQSFIVPLEIRPRLMAGQFTLLSVPYINWRDPKGIGRVILYNVKTGKKRVLMEFATFKKGMVRKSTSEGSYSFSMSHSALTPLLILTYDQGKMYYGMSNRYQITVSDLEIKKLFSFSVSRKKRKVPGEFKTKVLEGIDFPDRIKKEIKRGFPDHFTYFYRIIIDKNGLIYAVVTVPMQENLLKLDIFSPTGVFIYTAEIKVNEDLSIERYLLKGDKLYLGLENDEGDLTIIKYRISLPPL